MSDSPPYEAPLPPPDGAAGPGPAASTEGPLAQAEGPPAGPPSVGAASPAKAGGFPRAAVVAIAVSGLFCALTLGFLTLFAQRIQAGPAIAGVNAFVLMNGFATAFMVVGSLWMLWKLLPQAQG